MSSAGVCYSRGVRPKRKLDPAIREALQALGRIGGKKGGKARWKGVSREERSEIARKAARARWAKAKAKG